MIMHSICSIIPTNYDCPTHMLYMMWEYCADLKINLWGLLNNTLDGSIIADSAQVDTDT